MSDAPKVLIVRFSAIGDCVMTAWSVTSIRNEFPNAHITWAVEKRCRETIDCDHLVNQVAIFDRAKEPSSLVRFQRLLRSYLSLREQRYDWGIDFQGHGKTALALRIARPRKRLAVSGSDFFSARLNPRLKAPAPGLHIIEKNQLALSYFGDFFLPERPLMPVPPLKSGQPDPDVVIAVGAGQPAKTWPISKWEETAHLLSQSGLQITFIGGAKDPHPRATLGRDCVGKLSLAESMALIARARIVLCGDTGAGHIAAAYGVPVVSIFGPTSPATYRPWTITGTVLHNGPSVDDVSVEEAVDAVLGMVRERVV